MTSSDAFDLKKIFDVLGQLCVALRVSKGVTTFYDSPAHEKLGEGETFVCYDDGAQSRLAVAKRSVNPTGLVVKVETYQAVDAEPFTDLERERVTLIENVLMSIFSRRRLQAVVERMTFWDDDGYRNLRFFMSSLGRLSRAGRLAGMVAFRVNLKGYALVNQQVGRAAADAVMKDYYRQMLEAVGPEGLVCRLGGDNFVLLCPADRADATVDCLQGRTIAFRTGRPGEASDGQVAQDRVNVTAVAGAYAIPEDFKNCTPDDVMDRIMSTFQVAKSGREGDILFYSEALIREKERIMRVQQGFQQALRDETFLVYYQPKVNINSLELIGAEALCRWQRDGQLIPPGDFVPVLERGTDICRLDFYMLDHVCQDIRRWLDQNMPVVKISVNLSRRHMMDPDLLEHIIGIVDRHNVPHEYIEIELTETTTDVEFKDLKRVVSGLQKAGIHTSVDDFGVGYSSLNLIKEIPWNVLKLDRSLLPDRENMKRGSQMYRHIVSMAREIGLECVAEGVETSEQMDILREYGCDIVQGFYFDKPLPVADFEKRMIWRTY